MHYITGDALAPTESDCSDNDRKLPRFLLPRAARRAGVV